jgi:hypothetical protein
LRVKWLLSIRKQPSRNQSGCNSRRACTAWAKSAGSGSGSRRRKTKGKLLLVERLPLSVPIVTLLADHRGKAWALQQGLILAEDLADPPEALMAMEEATDREDHQQGERHVRLRAGIGERLNPSEHAEKVGEGEEGIREGGRGRLEARGLPPGMSAAGARLRPRRRNTPETRRAGCR